MERDKEFRRHQEIKREKKARAVAKQQFGSFSKDNREKIMEHWVKVSADNLQRCSCSACGNKRKFSKGKEKLTRQERRMLESDNNFE